MVMARVITDLTYASVRKSSTTIYHYNPRFHFHHGLRQHVYIKTIPRLGFKNAQPGNELNLQPKLDLPLDFLNFKGEVQKVKLAISKGIPIVHHHGYVSHLPPGHRFAMRKFHGVMKYLRRDNVVSMKQVLQPEPLSAADAQLAHTSEYVEKFFQGNTSAVEQRQTGFVWNDGLARRCRLEAGGTILGAQLAIEQGLACSTGGGTHHAHPSHGSGFCLLNDLAIAARWVIQEKLADRVLIVDLDVHQGDGTALIFEDDDSVFTFSMHAANNFPLQKQLSDLDIALPDNTQDKEYMDNLQTHLPWLLETFRPDLILYDAGVDPHERDELGRLMLSDKGLYDRDYYVIDEAAYRGIPCMMVIGGGYCRDVRELSVRHTIVHRAATRVWHERSL